LDEADPQVAVVVVVFGSCLTEGEMEEAPKQKKTKLLSQYPLALACAYVQEGLEVLLLMLFVRVVFFDDDVDGVVVVVVE